MISNALNSIQSGFGTDSLVTIDDLPAEMINELFKHLHPVDLAACSAVCKRWHSIYAGFKLTSLVSADRPCVWREWGCRKREYREQELCRPKMFRRLADKPLVSKLKHLTIGESTPFDLKKLSNHFGQLLHLEIHTYLDIEKVSLNFLNLKVLAFHYFNDYTPLSIDCPQLTELIYNGEPENKTLLVVRWPETIRKMTTGMIGPKLFPFRNVDCLITKNFSAIRKATLLSLPELKELHYNAGISQIFLDMALEIGTLESRVDRMKQRLTEFLDDVRFFRAAGFQFKFAGFPLTKAMLNEIDFDLQTIEIAGREREDMSDERIYLKNYPLIERSAINFVHTLNYNALYALRTAGPVRPADLQAASSRNLLAWNRSEQMARL